MLAASIPVLLGLASVAISAEFDPYFANLTWMAPRSLSNASSLNVETSTGTFIGSYNDTYPDVRQFLRVPFAQPPVGDLRWLPPQKPKPSQKRIDSTYFGPSCPQFVSSTASLWNEYEPPNPIINIGEKSNQGAVAWASAEDCLSLAVWTPAFANASSKLPVSLFVTGGGGVTGGVNIPSQIPTQWVSRSQQHISIAINYRSNIIGNPRSRALNETSLTLLDVRAATEWVYENIEAFGGDPDNIMLWGQSQGAALVHQYTLAWPKDPLAARFGIISYPPGTTINESTIAPGLDAYSDFDTVAQGLGCDYGTDYEAELECMRSISWVQLEEYINNYNATPSISFSKYVADERYIFTNETERYLNHLVAPGPAIRSDASREIPSATNETATIVGAQAWTCSAASDTQLREAAGLETYRYLYAGNFTNISPVPWLGAFHWTDLFMIFGTYGLDVGPISDLEVATSDAMQDYFLAFLKGDPASVNWPLTTTGNIIEFGKDVAVTNITEQYLDGGCYNSSIPYPVNG